MCVYHLCLAYSFIYNFRESPFTFERIISKGEAIVDLLIYPIYDL